MDARGGWTVDGERIDHERTVRVLTENVRLMDDGTFVTSIGRETAPCTVEDVGFFVRAVEIAKDGLAVRLSDRSEEVLAKPELAERPDGRLYCRVKDGRAWALFSSAAHQALEPAWGEQDHAIGLVVCGHFVRVASF